MRRSIFNNGSAPFAIAPLRTPTKFQQDFGHTLPNEQGCNKKSTTLSKVLVDASGIEKHKKLKKELSIKRRKKIFIEVSESL